jgi:hypothetical protein
VSPITLFSFGYWGWGNAVPQLVEAIDAVEKSRGYAPLIFADIRISRSVRAAGFDGNAFEKVVGAARYRWMDSLGNLAIRQGGEMRIKDPAAAGTLLELATTAAKSKRRVIYYCACETPCNCHRYLVSKLLLEAAKQRSQAAEIVEWPGGEPGKDAIEIPLPRAAFDKVRRGANSVPLPAKVDLAKMAALPWYSLLLVRPEDDDAKPTWRLVTGPARYRKTGWYLPVHGALDEQTPAAMYAEVMRAREDKGYQALVRSARR